MKKNKSWIVIMKRELCSYFTSPVAYIVGALFLLFSGFLFFSTFFLLNKNKIRNKIELIQILFSFFISAMTLRIFRVANKFATMETINTIKIKNIDINAGK